MPTPITKRQKDVLDFLESFRKKSGYAPTLEEIGKKLKLSAVSTVHQHIKALEEKGYISKYENLARGVALNKSRDSSLRIPVLGFIAAGSPIEAIEETTDYVTVTNDSIKDTKSHYALRVIGDSMIEEGIFDGDVVVIKQQSVAENGQTVVAIIDNNQATLKKLYREKDGFRLQPANQNLLPFFRQEVEVRGIVVIHLKRLYILQILLRKSMNSGF